MWIISKSHREKNFFYIFLQSSRHENHCQMRVRLFCLFHGSKNQQCLQSTRTRHQPSKQIKLNPQGSVKRYFFQVRYAIHTLYIIFLSTINSQISVFSKTRSFFLVIRLKVLAHEKVCTEKKSFYYTLDDRVEEWSQIAN